jgi:hypothetical protein
MRLASLYFANPDAVFHLKLASSTSSLHDFLADADARMLIADTTTIYLDRIHNCIVMDDALAGWYTDSVDAGYIFRSNVS